MKEMKDLSQYIEKQVAKYRLAADQVRQEKAYLIKASRRIEDVGKAQKIIQSVAATLQQKAHKRIASVVSRCLKAVFGEKAYEFKIKFEQKRGKTEARLLFLRRGHEVNPVSASAGGAVDVAAFALRLACLCLGRPKRRKFLMLDEPFRFLSAEYRPAVRDMVDGVSRELGVQILMVTHSRALMMGKVVEL